MLPNLLLNHQVDLNINSGELNVLVHLLYYKWGEGMPYPAVDTIARKMGVHHTTVRRHIRTMEKKHIVRRYTRTNSTNLYDFSWLVDRLREYSKGSKPHEYLRREGYANSHRPPLAISHTNENAVKKPNEVKVVISNYAEMLMTQKQKLANDKSVR
jgi:hypothetical protein